MPTSVCIAAGCPNPPVYRGRCEQHRAEQNRATHKPEAKRIYNSKQWRNTRNKMLDLCAECGKATGEHLDHITPLADGGEPYHPDNLQSLCQSCHSKKTRRETRNRSVREVYP